MTDSEIFGSEIAQSNPWLEPTWQGLVQRVQDQTLPHALLLIGPDGIGKRALAAQLAALVLCQQPHPAGRACGQCRACQMFAAGSHPELRRCAPEPDSKVIKVDQIRLLSEQVALTSQGDWQVFLIDPADRMNVNAANALLKTLEEPRPGSLLILLAESRGRLPATILSRCQQLILPRPTREDALAFVQSKVEFDQSQVEQALLAAADSPGLAIRYLNDDSMDDWTQCADELAQIAGGQADPAQAATAWTGETLAQRLEWLSRWLIALARGHRQALPESLSGLLANWSDGGNNRHRVHDRSKNLIMMAEKVNRGRALLETAARPELVVEELLIDWQHLCGKVPRRQTA